MMGEAVKFWTNPLAIAKLQPELGAGLETASSFSMPTVTNMRIFDIRKARG